MTVVISEAVQHLNYSYLNASIGLSIPRTPKIPILLLSLIIHKSKRTLTRKHKNLTLKCEVDMNPTLSFSKPVLELETAKAFE